MFSVLEIVASEALVVFGVIVVVASDLSATKEVVREALKDWCTHCLSY